MHCEQRRRGCSTRSGLEDREEEGGVHERKRVVREGNKSRLGWGIGEPGNPSKLVEL